MNISGVWVDEYWYLEPAEKQKVTRTIPVEELIERGYCRISKQYKKAARIDRDDWLRHMFAMKLISEEDYHWALRWNPKKKEDRDLIQRLEHEYRMKLGSCIRLPIELYNQLPHSNSTIVSNSINSILNSDEEDVGVF